MSRSYGREARLDHVDPDNRMGASVTYRQDVDLVLWAAGELAAGRSGPALNEHEERLLSAVERLRSVLDPAGPEVDPYATPAATQPPENQPRGHPYRGVDARPVARRGDPVSGAGNGAGVAGERCPATSDGLPCQKRHLPGRDYHGGGHWYATDEQWALMRQGHYNASSLLSGEVTKLYTAETCPGPPECYHYDHLAVRRG